MIWRVALSESALEFLKETLPKPQGVVEIRTLDLSLDLYCDHTISDPQGIRVDHSDAQHEVRNLMDFALPSGRFPDDVTSVVNVAKPEGILLVAAGGPGMGETWMLMPHLAHAITREIEPAKA